MERNVIVELSQDTHTPFHQSLLQHVKALVDMSREAMGVNYDGWDRMDETYRGEMYLDKKDRKAIERGDPEKMVVPVSYSQVQTFVAFCYSVLFQREYFFELGPMGVEAEKASHIAEALLQRDLDHNKFSSLAYQHLLDVARFGLGVFKVMWEEETQQVEVEQPAEVGEMLGQQVVVAQATTKTMKVPKWQGNKILNVSPYRFFPDPRLPLRRFQEGEFVASEDEFSYATLKKLESEGVVAGIDLVQTMVRSETGPRSTSRVRFSDRRMQAGQSNSPVVVTEVQVSLVPSKYEVDGKPLGPEGYPVKYLVWYANDHRIIRCEPLNYVHDEFTYTVAEFSPDLHHFVNEGLSESIDKLQEVISWFINSHITSVRKIIQNQLVVDPKMIEMDDIREHRSTIRLKEGAGRLGIERAIHQLQMQDVTANHMDDARLLQQMVQIVTGINDNTLGQFHTGRRSAQEARNVSAGTASRLKMVLTVLYYSAYEPLGRQMLSNLRDGLSAETYVKVFGILQDPQMEAFSTFKNKPYGDMMPVTKADLVGDYDFEVLDGTLPSEKFHQGEALGETLGVIMQNPQLAVFLGFDVKKIFFELMRLRGIRHPEKFVAGSAQQQLLIQLSQQANANTGAQGTGGEVSRNGQGGPTGRPAATTQ